MGEVQVGEALAAGSEALAEADWGVARQRFDEAVASVVDDDAARARAATGLSDACWWLGDVDDALRARQLAYEAWRRAGDDLAAAHVATWLAREYLGALGNDAAARGWLHRAETLGGDPVAPDIAGWIALTRASMQPDQGVQLAAAEEALELARAGRDGDLEALALARKGLYLIADGDLDAGLACFHEAMAMATAGETTLATLGYVGCDLVFAAELWGDVEPFARWNDVLLQVAMEHGHAPLLAFCATCCAEVFSLGGDWKGAEEWLRTALDQLRETGQRARCVPPTAKLGELLISRGRLEEAEELLRDDLGEDTLVVRARLALAQGSPGTAITLLRRTTRRLGRDSLLSVPALGLLVQAHLAREEVEASTEVAERIAALAETSGNGRVAGLAALARGRIYAAGQATGEAASALEEALDHLATVAPGSMELAETHLELARLQAGAQPDVAIAEAKAAVAGFETVGATARIDEAAALLRSLGDRSRVGPKGVGTLTQREQEVLRLLPEGLTNAELAERLFISPKTAANHVSNILMKLNLRSRAEAATYALRHLGD